MHNHINISTPGPVALLYPPIASADDVHQKFSYVPATNDADVNPERLSPAEVESCLTIMSARRADGWQTMQTTENGPMVVVMSVGELVGKWQLRRCAQSATPPEPDSEEWLESRANDDLTKTWEELTLAMRAQHAKEPIAVRSGRQRALMQRSYPTGRGRGSGGRGRGPAWGPAGGHP